VKVNPGSIMSTSWAGRLKSYNNQPMSLEIKNGEVYVNSEKTTDPTLIGYAVIDFAENTTEDPEGKYLINKLYNDEKENQINRSH